ncbi:MAG TPA: FtsQ-type POTRA domain-containing protein [Hyphomicrobiaceae bacterium]|nr:FtsQ-type POTRA domain-containing protein [Hyphomicrobiaceae bacterium]
MPLSLSGRRSGPRHDRRAADLSKVPGPAPFERRTPARSRARRLAVFAAILTGACIFAVLTEGGRATRSVRSLGEQIDDIATMAGFGLRQINVTGHRMTPDASVFDALELSPAASLLRFDVVAARRRIERLPWVETATIERIFPDEITVTLTERAPYAVWRKPGGDVLIDKEGRELGPAYGSHAGALPVIAGEGAALLAHILFRNLASYPELRSRLVEAERVADRRWTLTLERGMRIHLPAGNEAAALVRLMAPRPGGRLIDRDLALVDLRAEDRIIVRRDPAGPTGAAAPRH